MKIDRLMNLIGEMVVAKNALPYLAGRPETVFGVRELSREIKALYAVINRIAEAGPDRDGQRPSPDRKRRGVAPGFSKWAERSQ